MPPGVLQLVSGNGEFNGDGLEEFVREAKIDTSGVDYNLVAITGPQSSGKSTLLNSLFGTNFEEMDAMSGRHQTTRGIWLASAPKVSDPPTVVLDLEGSDGRERGEDDTSFERQSALFALAVADVVLVNMWAKDVGREAGSGKPLLKTIFQVNLKLFQPAPNRRRTVLLFVFRDRTRTPLPLLIETWEADLARMWEGITKPPGYEQYAFTDFFEVAYASLPNYEEKGEEFNAETVLLRRRFSRDEEDSFLRPSDEKLPGHALSLSMAKVWEVVREHKDLNLPAHRVMVAGIRCAEIAADALEAFQNDPAWAELEAGAGQEVLDSFGASLGELMDSYLQGYDEEARYFERGVSQAKRSELLTSLHNLAKPAYDDQLELLQGLALGLLKRELAAAGDEDESFVERAARLSAAALDQFDAQASLAAVPGTDWDASDARAGLEKGLEAHIASVRAERVGAASKKAQEESKAAVSAGAAPLLEAPPADLWARLGRLVARARSRGEEVLSVGILGYGVGEEEGEELQAGVAEAAKAQLLVHMREAANTALARVKDRFSEVFQRDESGLPRSWAPPLDIPAVALESRTAAARLLAQLAVVRLGEPKQGCDVIEAALLALAKDPSGASSIGAAAAGAGAGAAPAGNGTSSAAAGAGGGFDFLSASEWPGVSKSDVLLSPQQCRAVWRSLAAETALAVQQAQATQEATRAARSKMPPVWALFAMVILGFNEAMAVLRNPLLLLLLLLLFLFGRTVYQELDVEGELQKGLLPGVLSLSAKFMPTMRQVAHRTFESLKQLLQEQPAGGGNGNGNNASTPQDRRTGASGGGAPREVRLGEGGPMQGAGARAGPNLRRRREVEMAAVGGYDSS